MYLILVQKMFHVTNCQLTISDYTALNNYCSYYSYMVKIIEYCLLEAVWYVASVSNPLYGGGLFH